MAVNVTSSAWTIQSVKTPSVAQMAFGPHALGARSTSPV